MNERAARDRALAQVVRVPWMDCAMSLAVTILPKTPFAAEDLRPLITAIIGPPHHHNAWGALTKKLLDGEYIKPTGLHRAMRAKGSHARQTPLYLRSDWVWP